MRTLVLLRGLPGVGKSTWIKDQGLDPYTLSADQIRLLTQPPQLSVNGKPEISSKHDHKVWSLLFELLTARIHGGLAHLPEELLHVSTQQLIHGVGEYSDDIDHLFIQNTAGLDVIQIHGHRNLYRLPIQAAERSYNLEGQVEFGGQLVSKQIVSRSYNKFFNIDERPETKMHHLVNHLQFPVTVYDKANGYLGTVGYNEMEDELVFTSKSYTSHVKHNQHASWIEELFYQTFGDVQIDYIKSYVRDHNVSLVFEVILPEKDPHIITYDQDQLILLDIVKRQLSYEKAPFTEVKRVSEQLGMSCKQEVAVFNDWTSFYKWYQAVSHDDSIKEEGFVIEDHRGFMTKLKLPYYQFWKQMRAIKQRVAEKRSSQKYMQALQTAEQARFYTWLLEQDANYVRNSSIIELRSQFEQTHAAELNNDGINA